MRISTKINQKPHSNDGTVCEKTSNDDDIDYEKQFIRR